MTEDDIKQMTADREAGTPGPWRVGPVDDTRVESADGSEVADIDGDYNQPETWPVMEANARRIARVPDLEAEVLRLRQALKIIAGYSQCIDNLMSNVDVAREALEGKKNDQ